MIDSIREFPMGLQVFVGKGTGENYTPPKKCFLFIPFPGRIINQQTPPINAMPAARPRATGQPKESAIQGVSVGESVPPKLAPVFIRPESVPA